MTGSGRSNGWRLRAAVAACVAVGGISTLVTAQEAGQPAAPAAATGTANLNINPKRVTFDRLGRSSSVYIFNQGTGPGSFDIQLIDRIMLPNGQIMPLDEAAQKPELKDIVAKLKAAQGMVLLTPRRATLVPGTGQTIRVRAGGAGDTPPGEYRSHLTVTALPPPDTGVTAEQAATQAPNSLSFRVNSVLGISIPVIIRVGPADVRAGIENAKLAFEDVSLDGVAPAKRTPILSIDLVRLGTSSLFGDIEVRGAKERGSALPMGIVRGVGVYTEIDRRYVKIALQRIPAAKESIEISFKDDDTSPGKLLAKVSIAAP